MAGKKSTSNPLDLVLAPAPGQTSAPETGVDPATMTVGDLRKALQKESEISSRKAEERAQVFYREIIAEDQVSLTLAPLYQPYFGRVMTVGLNGVTIYFPVDGRQYKVPKSFAAIIQHRRRAADDQIMRRARMSNIQENHESYTGELKFY